VRKRGRQVRTPKPKRRYDYVCRYCKGWFQHGRSNRRHCGDDECRLAYNAERMREFNAKKAEELGESYYRQFRAGAYEKAKAHPDGPPRTRYADTYRKGDQVRRARKLGATVEEFSDLEIYERDGWTCQLCSGDVDSSLRWPEPMSASLDHVIPLSRGGEHSRVNTQLAHLDCNVRKGAKIEAP